MDCLSEEQYKEYVDKTRIPQAYYYDLEEAQNYVLKEMGIWEYDDPPTGIVIYLKGTEVHIGNDYPYIKYVGAIEVAREIHKACAIYLY